MDISPNYSATIFGFGTAIASLPGFFNALLMNLLIEGTVSVNFITILSIIIFYIKSIAIHRGPWNNGVNYF